AKLIPSGAKATADTKDLVREKWTTSPVATFHRQSVPSLPPESSHFPSGEKAMQRVALCLLLNGRTSLPVRTSHRRMIPSCSAVARVLLSGEKARAFTSPTCFAGQG